MLDKFLKNIETFAKKNTEKKELYYVEEHNKKVLNPTKVKVADTPYDDEAIKQTLNNMFKSDEKKSKSFSKIQKNTFQSFEPKNNSDFNKKTSKSYEDDGSYFCAYPLNGNKIVCLKNKEKFEFELDGINHPDPHHFLAKKSNYKLNDLIKKQKVYLTHNTDNNKVIVFLDKNKTENVNQLIIDEGFGNSDESNKEKFKNDNKEKPQKLNFAFGVFVKNHNQFDALFNNNKITIKLFGLNLYIITLFLKTTILKSEFLLKII